MSEKYFWEKFEKHATEMNVYEYENAAFKGSGLFDFDIELNNFIGSGTDSDKSIALAKAYSEAVERQYLIKKGISFFASAAHYSKEESKKNAFLELLERDAFLGTFYSNLNFKKIAHNTDQIPPLFFSDTTNVSYYDLSYYKKYHLHACVLNLPDGGVILGLGSSRKNSTESIRKSAIEVVRKVDNIVDVNSDDAVIRHFSFWATKKNSLDFFPSRSEKHHIMPPPTYKISSDYLDEYGLWVSYINITNANFLSYKQPAYEFLSKDRIDKYFRGFQTDNILNLPHPIS